MGDRSAVPMRESESGREVTANGGWIIGDDEVLPGDTIRWCPALDTGPRGREAEAWHDDVISGDAEFMGEPLAVHALPDLDNPPVCGFCNPPIHVRERGTIAADYELMVEDTTVVHSCHACISEAPRVDD